MMEKWQREGIATLIYLASLRIPCLHYALLHTGPFVIEAPGEGPCIGLLDRFQTCHKDVLNLTQISSFFLTRFLGDIII